MAAPLPACSEDKPGKVIAVYPVPPPNICSMAAPGGAASPPCRQRSRHARFADGENGSESSAKDITGSGRSSVASARAEQPQAVSAAASAALLSQPSPMPTSTAVAKPLQPEQPLKPAVPARQLTDQSVPSDLMEAERRSELSGLSGSSCSSALSRLSAYGRRRSRRSDYPPLMGESLFCLKVRSCYSPGLRGAA